MSQATSPSTGRPYGVERVCRIWEQARSTVYARHRGVQERKTGGRMPLKRGPKPVVADEALRTWWWRIWRRLRFRGKDTARSGGGFASVRGSAWDERGCFASCGRTTSCPPTEAGSRSHTSIRERSRPTLPGSCGERTERRSSPLKTAGCGPSWRWSIGTGSVSVGTSPRRAIGLRLWSPSARASP